MSNGYDVVAFGTCYVDYNVSGFPFRSSGILPETELVGESYNAVPGGSAVNFCTGVRRLGLSPAFIGMAGTDVSAELFVRLLREHGVEPKMIHRDGLTTNIGFNMTSLDGQHIMLGAGTANKSLNPEDVLATLSELLPVSPLLYIGGCIKLNLFENSFEKIAELAARNRSRIIVDHGRIREITSENMRSAVKELVLRAAYYLPSRDEFCALWGVTDISEGLRRLHVSSPHLTTVIKDGENGAYFLENGKVMQVEAVEVKEIVNLTGAGDAFNAGFIASQAAGKSIRESVLAGTENAARWISQP